MTRSALVAPMVLAAAVVGCGSNGDTAAETSSRVERCADRLLQRAPEPEDEQGRRYVMRTYCGPFDDRGWVYDDGVLNIEAYHELERGGTCATTKPGGPVETVPCKEPEAGPLILDCAILHIVRRSEVADYVADLEQQENREVKCDDGTPLTELGTE